MSDKEKVNYTYDKNGMLVIARDFEDDEDVPSDKWVSVTFADILPVKEGVDNE